MDCRTLRYSRHAIERMFQREISPDIVSDIAGCGRIIAEYPDDKPYPSVLLLGFHDRQPVHVVLSHDEVTGDCHVVTAYRPDPMLWDDAFEKRRES